MLAKWLPGSSYLPSAEEKSSVEESIPTTLEDAEEIEHGAEPAVFDKASVMERMGGDEAIIKIISEAFLGDIPKQILILKSFVEIGDAVGSRNQVHRIKGAAANVGGERLREIGYRMEELAKQGDLSAVSALIPALEKEFAELKLVMEEECK